MNKPLIALALACAVSLSACGSAASSASPSAAEAPTATAAPAATAEPTPEPTAAPPASADAFAAFESGLDYIGAKTGYKYKVDGFTVELYQFDPDSDAYKQAVSDNAVTMDGFGTIPAYVHDGLAMLCTDGDLPQSVLDVFNAL